MREDFARSLRVLRTRARLTVRDTATRLAQRTPDAASSSTLGGWFSGSHLPTPKLVKNQVFAELLGVCGEPDPVEVREWVALLPTSPSTPTTSADVRR